MLTQKFAEEVLEIYQNQPVSHQKKYQIGPLNIEVVFCRLGHTDHFTKAIAHLKVRELDSIDLTIYVADQAHSGLKLPQPTWDWAETRDNGYIPTFDDTNTVANFTQFSNTFYLLDRTNQRAFYWTRDVQELPEWERSFPFRYILSHFCRTQSHLLLLHAGAVGTANSGVLLTGKGGSGKSTAALSCLGSELLYAGDDMMLVDTEKNMIYSLYNVAKLEAHQLKLFPHFEPLVYNPAAMPAEKAQLFVFDHFPKTLIRQMPLKAIILPKFSGQTDTEWTTDTAAEALRALAPSTIGLFQEDEQYLNKLAILCRQVPIFRLATGTDLAQIPEKIAEILAIFS